MDFELYRLPDGRIIPVDATASKGAKVIGFTEKGGRVVDAEFVAKASDMHDFGRRGYPETLDGRV